MPSCILCGLPSSKRAAIERDIASGRLSFRAAAEQCSCGKDSVSRHMSNHVGPAVRDAIRNDVDKAHALNTVDQLLDNLNDVQGVLKRALDRGDDQGDRTALKALAEWRKNIELTARITGQFSDAPQVNIMMSPLFVKIQQVMIETLLPYPKARQVLSKGLDALAEEIEQNEFNE